jgi:murein DD-endopeptidase MepM/ murein hydrolase activator NlpD
MKRALWWLALLAACSHAPPPPPDRSHDPRHLVQPGETPYGIARRYGVSVEALLAANRIDDPRRVRAGARLIIPPAGPAPEPDPPAAQTSTRAEIPALPPPPPPADLGAMRATFQPSPARGSAPLIWPTDGVVISLFGRRDGARHDGVDIAAPLGSAVWAAAAGKVIFSGQQPGYGWLVIIAHDDALATVYAHNAVNLVAEGDRVEQGDPIAQVGISGGQQTPQLHFEVRLDKEPVNPLPRLPP